jgi:hypothetical protein
MTLFIRFLLELELDFEALEAWQMTPQVRRIPTCYHVYHYFFSIKSQSVLGSGTSYDNYFHCPFYLVLTGAQELAPMK